jgi:hypothetical protein
MSDRLALANAIEDAGIERAKAERIASTIVDLIHDNVATKADVQRLEAVTKADVQASEAAIRADLQVFRATVASEIARLETRIERLDGKIDQTGSRTFNRLGALVAVVATLLFGALHLWPPH